MHASSYTIHSSNGITLLYKLYTAPATINENEVTTPGTISTMEADTTTTPDTISTIEADTTTTRDTISTIAGDAPSDHSCRHGEAITASVLSGLISAVLTAIVCVTGQIIMFKCHRTKRRNEHAQQWKEHEYAEVGDIRGTIFNVKSKDYASVEELSVPDTRSNEAYGVSLSAN